MAQENRVDLQTTVDTNLATGIAIPAVDHRAVETNLIDSNLNLLDDVEQGTLTCVLVDIGATATYSINGTNEFRYSRILDFVKFRITLTNIDADVQGTGDLRLNINAMPSSIEIDSPAVFTVLFSSDNSSGFASIISLATTIDGIVFPITNSITSNNNTIVLDNVDFAGGLNAITIEGTYFVN